MLVEARGCGVPLKSYFKATASAIYWCFVFLAMPLYSLKTANAILNASYKAGKARRLFPFSVILRSQYYYTHVLEVTTHAQCT